MVTLPPPQHEQLPEMVYGHHPNFGMYPQDVNRGPQQHMNYNQPAPRQRTAIACRYCRRRKVGRADRLNANGKTDKGTDSLLWLRGIRRRPLHQLPAFPARVHLYTRFVASASIRARTHGLSTFEE